MPGEETIVLTETGMQVAAFWSRIACGYGLADRFDPLSVLERLSFVDGTFNYKILESKDWQWGNATDALYIPQSNIIIIRADVYDDARGGNHLAILTIAHEICHYIQFLVKNILGKIACVEFTTEFCTEGSEAMCHHEEQTDAMAEMVLFPRSLTEGKTQEEILQNYVINPLMQLICGLIKTAAKWLMQSLEDTAINIKEVEACAV